MVSLKDLSWIHYCFCCTLMICPASALCYCDLWLYAGDTCILYSHENIGKIEECLNSDFNRLCGKFVDSKLSICFGKDQTKCILFTGKTKAETSYYFILLLNMSQNSLFLRLFGTISHIFGTKNFSVCNPLNSVILPVKYCYYCSFCSVKYCSHNN